MLLNRRQIVAGLAVAPLAVDLAEAQGKPEFYPIPVELLAPLERLNGRVSVGNPAGDVHLIEFFDYNCAYCKRAAKDIRQLLAGDKNLRITLINYAVLGIPSIGATRVALAFSRQKADKYLAFHEALIGRRGTIGPDHAIEIALKFGVDRKRLVEDADSDPVTEAMKAASKLGESLGFQATPSYLLGRDGFAGFLDLAAKKAAIAAFRQCERATCS